MEFFNEDYEENYYDDDDVEQYVEADPLGISASQRVTQHEVTQAVDGSVHTQLGAAPGTTNIEEVVPGLGNGPRLRPDTVSNVMPAGPVSEDNLQDVSFLSSGDEAGHRSILSSAELGTNPDGSPIEDMEDEALLNELQRVQRDIANRRADRRRRLELQLLQARRALEAEAREDMTIFSSPPATASGE